MSDDSKNLLGKVQMEFDIRFVHNRLTVIDKEISENINEEKSVIINKGEK